MYKKLTDEQILELYKNGDERALDFLLNRYKWLASKKARSYFLVGAESEDLLQEAMLGLYTACRKFDVGSGNKFLPFASMCITGAILDAVKTANRKKHNILNDRLTLTSQGTVMIEGKDEDNEDICMYIPSAILDPEDALLNKERKKEINDIINENLSLKEKKVLVLYLQGLSYREIAENLGETTKSVDNAIARTKKKLAELL